nr:DUF2799 domain-containing protein [Vibrio sonorensis]
MWLFAMLVTLTACSTQYESGGDWYQKGYQDGIRGHAERSNSSMAAVNGEQRAQYDQGYLIGVKEYCNPNFAYQIGLSGQVYEGVCEGMEEAQKFRMEWQRGWNDYTH